MEQIDFVLCLKLQRVMAIAFPQVNLVSTSHESPQSEENPWLDLWDRESRSLNQELLISGSGLSYTKYRSAICRGKNRHFSSRLSKAKATSSCFVVEQGVFKSLKFWINSPTSPPCLEIFEDSLLFYSQSYSEAVERTKERRELIFAHIFITTPPPACDLALGLYAVGDFLGGQRNCWRLLRVDDEASGAPACACPTPEVRESVEEAAADAAPPVVQDSTGSSAGASVRRPPCSVLQAASAHQPVSLARGSAMQSRRFSHDGDHFDSQLECIHREAFKRMGLKYVLSRNSFQIGHALRTRVQRSYTPDGVLHVPLGSPEAPLSIVHVEIKPGRLTVEESDLCFALCQTMQQHVLCISAGYVSDTMHAAILQESRSMGGPTGDYCSLPRSAPFMEMNLYQPRGIDLPVFYYPSVSWVSTGSRAPGYYLSAVEPADPLDREREMMRLVRIYYLATKDASKMSRGQQEPY